jgi:acetyl esterase/lipase
MHFRYSSSAPRRRLFAIAFGVAAAVLNQSFTGIASCCLLAAEPRVELLWAAGAPGAVGTEDADKPTLTFWQAPAELANGCGVVVCPGGGYGALAVDHEGKQIAEWFNSFGVTAVMLKYRHAPRYKHPTPMQDVQRAIRTVRSRAAELAVDPARIGIMGFSAGGHLASTAATKFDDGHTDAADAIDRVSCRPDFAILCYPVITMTDPFTHKGSRNNLLGKEPDEKLVQLMSNETQVTAKTPPTFLFHTTEDTAVPPENSILFCTFTKKDATASGSPRKTRSSPPGPPAAPTGCACTVFWKGIS